MLIRIQVKGKLYPNTYIKPLLAALTAALPSTPQHNIPQPQLPPPRVPLDAAAEHITQSWLWPQFEKFLRPGDIVIGETGTAIFGLYDIKFPTNTRWHAQIYYGSIGFATAATLGAEIARRELEAKGVNAGGRTILVTGDGSMNLTIQEIGTMIKQGIKPVIFVLNNEGYTIERLIWGARQRAYFHSCSSCADADDEYLAYNDIVPADYSYLLPLFKHPSPTAAFHRAVMKKELEPIFQKKELAQPESLQLVEVVMEKMDTSWRLGTQLAWRSEAHKKYLTDEGFVDTYGGWSLDGVSGGSVKWS